MQIINQLDSLIESATLTEADQALYNLMLGLGFEKFTYNFYPHDFHLTAKASHVLCTQQANKWQQHYTSQHYDEVDPIFNRMRASHLPLSWKVETELAKANLRQKKLFSDALDFGMRGGFAVPIHAPFGEFANLVIQDVASIKTIAQNPDIKHQLQLIAYQYHARVSQFLEIKNNINLTTREKECLQLTAQHKSAKEIARILNISLRTVGFHIENAIKKLGVNNKYQALAKINQRNLLR